MKRYKVVFRPYNKAVEVEEGTKILEAAWMAGVYINNLCGGEGVCGECRVIISEGDVEREKDSLSFFSEEELAQGYALACQTYIKGDVIVDIPAEARLEEEKILLEAEDMDSEQIQRRLKIAPFKPIARKIFLELSPPTMEDNITDFERIARGLRKKIGWHSPEIDLLTLREISDVLREEEWKVTVTLVKDRNTYRIQRIEPSNRVDTNLGVAVDVGTTTIVAQLIDLRTGRILATRGEHNSQAQFGEDVISRIIYACDKGGLPTLHEAVIDNVNQLIDEMCLELKIPKEDINAVVAAGNTTMSHLFLKIPPCYIRLQPYVPSIDVYPQMRAMEVGIKLSERCILEVLPSVSSYVGGDIVAGVLACGIPESDEIIGLIDIGTNGEIAIGNKEWLVCCSASAGPAFEGGGTTCGMRATKGAIEKLEIRDGDVHYETIGGGRARGICGSGLIDCVYELVKNGIIQSSGKFNKDIKDARLNLDADIPYYIIADREETDTGKEIVISESDIDHLIKSKGAIFAAIKSLMEYIGLQFDQIHRFYVAGGFGNYLNIRKAISIGLLPDIEEDRIRFVGNTSLKGAKMALCSEEGFERCVAIAKSMTNIELSNYQPYMDEYVAALFLPHTDKRLFPSVDY